MHARVATFETGDPEATIRSYTTKRDLTRVKVFLLLGCLFSTTRTSARFSPSRCMRPRRTSARETRR